MTVRALMDHEDTDLTYATTLDAVVRDIALVADAAGKAKVEARGTAVTVWWETGVQLTIWGASLNRMRNYYRQLWPANPAA